MTLALHSCPPPDSVPAGARPPAVEPAPLVRFVALGLVATLDRHPTGGLAAGRFGWEMSARIDQLAGLGLPSRTVTRLRWLARAAASHAGADGSTTIAELRAAVVALLGDEGA